MKKNKRLSHWARFCKLMSEYIANPKRLSLPPKATKLLLKAAVWQGPLEPGRELIHEIIGFVETYRWFANKLITKRKLQKITSAKSPAERYSALVDAWGVRSTRHVNYVNSTVLCNCRTPGTCDCNILAKGARAFLELVIPKRYYLLGNIQFTIDKKYDKKLAKTVYCVTSNDARKFGYIQVSLNSLTTAKFVSSYEDLERKKPRKSGPRHKYLKLKQILAWKDDKPSYQVLVKPKKDWCTTWECVIDAINRIECEKIQLDSQRAFVRDIAALQNHIAALKENKAYSHLVKDFIPTFVKLNA